MSNNREEHISGEGAAGCPMHGGEGDSNAVRAKASGCPMHGGGAALGGNKNRDWWPHMLDVSILRQHSTLSNPMDEGFNYYEEFLTLDLDEVKADLVTLMTDSQDWWPADYGHYGPFMIRMAWHVAGTYRTADGRGGSSQGLQRFAPTNGWPDNANLDKARRLLWPIKQKYGRKISWADLFILAGNCAHESMGLKPFGYGGGREDVWEPAEDIYWGHDQEWLSDEARYSEGRKLSPPLAAVQMGLIYVNPEGPEGVPDPLAAAQDIRETFVRMAMNDEETVALIAGGHTFGKAHGAADPSKYVQGDPNAAPVQEQGFGWKSSYKSGKGVDTITSGLEGAWTAYPTRWDTGYFDALFGYEWELGESPTGGKQWHAVKLAEKDHAPEVDDASKKVPTLMFTTDLALKVDPAYREISEKFHGDHQAFADAYAKAWYKLTHRDMGPIVRYLGTEVPKEVLAWQDPLPKAGRGELSEGELAVLKSLIKGCGLPIGDLVSTAWKSAATYRGSDRRGGANGARIRLEPQKSWAVNEPDRLLRVLEVYGSIQGEFFTETGKEVSLADLIVLAGGVGVELGAVQAGKDLVVPFTQGRVDAEDSHTDAESFSPLEPETDGFRNFKKDDYTVPSEHLLVDKAQLLGLSAPEMTVLLGGLRVLGASHGDAPHGVFTAQRETLSNDYFLNLLDVSIEWKAVGETDDEFVGTDRQTGMPRWMASRVDLIFGHHAELRAIAEVYACEDSLEKFYNDFVSAWVKVMELDRFDLLPHYQ